MIDASAHLYGGLVGRAMMWVHPSAMAARKGMASKTAASTRREPLCWMGSPATTGTVALALKHSRKSSSLLKFSRMTGWSVSKHDATTCTQLLPQLCLRDARAYFKLLLLVWDQLILQGTALCNLNQATQEC